jgi:hypothetical protein
MAAGSSRPAAANWPRRESSTVRQCGEPVEATVEMTRIMHRAVSRAARVSHSIWPTRVFSNDAFATGPPTTPTPYQ